MIQEFMFLSSDGHSNIQGYQIAPAEEPLAILQIVHGMSEYFTRYEGFADYLAQNGILVVGHDHIGHGKSADPENYGYFGAKDGWKFWIEDVHALRRIIQEKYPQVPYVILGHSMGSFILRAYLIQYGQGLAGAIITGTSGVNRLNGFGRLTVKAMRKVFGGRYRSQLVHDLAFGSNNKKIPSPKNIYEWLSSDVKVSTKYAEDPMCNFIFTLAGFADLFSILAYVSHKDWAEKVPREFPVLLASGLMDPVGQYGKGPSEVYEKLKKTGHEDVALLLYEDMRHEILNERGRAAVYGDMRDFILDAAQVDV